MDSLPAFAATRDRVRSDLAKALSADALAAAYGTDVPAPTLTVGGSAKEPPFEVIVHELAENVSTERQSTCPLPRLTWTQGVSVTAVKSTVEEAAAVAEAYEECVEQVAAADPTLGGTVEWSCFTRTLAGSAVKDGKYVVGLECGITCSREAPKVDAIYKEVKS